ncbi:hypothetical protein GTE7_gp077 [Gordonia phage GTE7]|uniref:Uncharacterized protein n=1 Tax=Gordonia phage GTE7 TaxID=1100814 RepID=G8FS70_9CAUD|nr:hypothetical protein GTE7_gp077 [Gordonia phage GTE7]AER26620.1 hypothetical protein [Gordonia phage GTE7]
MALTPREIEAQIDEIADELNKFKKGMIIAVDLQLDKLTTLRNDLVGASSGPSGLGLIAQRAIAIGADKMKGGKAMTFPQQEYIKNLCGERFARIEGELVSAQQASSIIGTLMGMPKVPLDQRDLSTEKPWYSRSPMPAPTVEQVEYLEYNVLNMVPDGRYAVTSDDGKQTVFMRLVTRKPTSRGSERRLVQQKSSDKWLTRQTYSKSGHNFGINRIHGTVIADLLTQIMMDKAGCSDRYGDRYSECVRCGRELTDDKSRYYRLGSECISYRPDLVDYVDNKYGVWTPGKASRDGSM